ncbi:MAG: divalent-cation tolerance protein CutA [Pseudomonadota bacterium]
MEIVAIQVNCPNARLAERIAERMIEARLAACANIRAPMTSLYRWKGAVETDPETPLILKTRAELFDRVLSAVRELHPDETPCVFATPIRNVNRDYLEWVFAETEGTGG